MVMTRPLCREKEWKARVVAGNKLFGKAYVWKHVKGVMEYVERGRENAVE
jgi:hypothetical protein